MVSKSLKAAITQKKTRRFLKRLWRLPFKTTKTDRVKALNSGEKKQRHVLILVLHKCVSGQIPVPKEYKNVLLQSGKMDWLQKTFLEKADVKRLLTLTDKEQKEVLAKVNNYHVLLHRVFNRG